MSYAIFTGVGAAPGVPSLSCGWNVCNPDNKLNIRRRIGTYYNFDGVEILIDTSPDLRQQLLDNQIRRLDAVLYTHAHADHLHGIDDLREINRINHCNLNIYAIAETLGVIKKRFDYMMSDPDSIKNVLCSPSLVPNEIECGHEFMIKNVKVMPLALAGHNVISNGYAFNDGEVVHIADFKRMPAETIRYLNEHKIKILVLPMTTLTPKEYHAGWEELAEYIKIINPEQVIINHMATECDYDTVNEMTPDNVRPAFDNMKIEW